MPTRLIGVAFFRQASEQYLTCSQFLAQDFRQLISRLQRSQSFDGKLDLLPLKLDFMATLFFVRQFLRAAQNTAPCAP